MRQILKQLLKMTAGYGAAQWAGPILSFIFTPIITRFLTPSDYGIADFALTVASALSIVMLFALPQALIAHFNDYPDEEWQKRLIGSALTVALLIGTPISLALIVLAPQVAQLTFGDQKYTHLFYFVGISAALAGASGTVLSAAAQAALRVRLGMLFSAVAILGAVISNMLFIVVLKLGATGMVLTPVAVGITHNLVALVAMRRFIGKPSLVVMKTVWISGALLLPTMGAAWALQLIDRFFLVQYVSTETLGYYAIANKIASLLYVMMAPLYSAWTPLALSIQHEPQAKEHYAIMARYLIGAVLLGGLGLGLFAPEILLIFTRSAYLPAAPYVGFLAYIHVFSGISTVLYTSALAGKQLKAVSLTTIAGAVTNIILNYILIPPYGVWGATAATVVGYGVPIVSLYFVLRNRFPVPYPVVAIVMTVITQFCLLVIAAAITFSPFSIRSIIVKLVLVGVLLASYLLVGMITKFEIQQGLLYLRNLVSSYRKQNSFIG